MTTLLLLAERGGASFFSDKFVFWPAIFIVAVPVLYFTWGLCSKKKKEPSDDLITIVSVFQAIALVTVLFYHGMKKGLMDKGTAFSVAYLNAIFVGIIFVAFLFLMLMLLNNGLVKLGNKLRNLFS